MLTIIEDFNGKIPGNMTELLQLPGVGRKTANCVLGECFNVPAMVIDTHMIRIMNLLGFTLKGSNYIYKFLCIRITNKKNLNLKNNFKV